MSAINFVQLELTQYHFNFILISAKREEQEIIWVKNLSFLYLGTEEKENERKMRGTEI